MSQELGPLSTNVIDLPPVAADPAESRPALRGPTSGSLLAVLAVLSPCLLAIGALLVHRYLPNKQELPMTWLDDVPAWQHPYPMLLGGLGAIFLLLALAQWACPPLRGWVRHHAPLVAGFIFLFMLWELITVKWNWMALPYFMGPDTVLGSMIEDREILFESTQQSLKLLLSGYLVGVTAGLISGVLMGWFRLFRYWGMPVLKLIGPIPATALIPLAMTLTSDSFSAATGLIGFAVWFPVTMLTASGIANVRLSYLDVARTLGAGRFYLIFRVAIPAALPNIFIGLFMALGASFLTLIVAETVGVRAGLGWYVLWQQGYMEYDKVYAALLIMAVFFSTIMTLLFKLRDWVLKWQKGVIRW
jgi:NitT/TauT family transport system permease protein